MISIVLHSLLLPFCKVSQLHVASVVMLNDPDDWTILHFMHVHTTVLAALHDQPHRGHTVTTALAQTCAAPGNVTQAWQN